MKKIVSTMLGENKRNYHIYTGYYAMEGSYALRFPELTQVSISRTIPCWSKVTHEYPSLMPTWEILNEYKKSGDEKAYIVGYKREILSKLNPQKVAEELNNCVLMCYEGKDKFCHRKVVADWLNNYFGTCIVKELIIGISRYNSIR